VIKHAEIKILFVSTAEQWAKVRDLVASGSSVELLVIFDQDGNGAPRPVSLKQFCSESSSLVGELVRQYEHRVEEVTRQNLATIIYTSGTTGPPKGVMLTHGNFLINCTDSVQAIDMRETDTVLSFLPLSHVFERMAGFYFPIMVGATIAYAENMTTVPENMREVHPNAACAVPRLYEKIHQRVMDTIEKSSPLKRLIIEWALRVGRRTIPYRLQNKAVPFLLRACYSVAVMLIFKKLQDQLGGHLRYFISGGAPLPKELGEFFFAAGVVILEGYGLTETSPVISVNRLQRLKFGTVGTPLGHVEVKIAEDGEIVVRGPSVMKGYYQNEKATAEVIRDGWFYTGDIGKIDSDGYLSVTDRKKDIIVTSGGKNISPQNIEQILCGCSSIQQAVVIGDRYHYLVALIVPCYEFLSQKLGLPADACDDIIASQVVRKLIRKEMDERMTDLPAYEQIKYFRLMRNELTLAKGELTPTLKVKRRVIGERYEHLIKEMYAEGSKAKRE